MNTYQVTVTRTSLKTAADTKQHVRIVSAGKARVAINAVLSGLPDVHADEVLHAAVKLLARNMNAQQYQEQQRAAQVVIINEKETQS